MISEMVSPALKTIYKGKEALDEYRAEVAAFANQWLLGNKSFVKKLITTDPSAAEKLIAKIRELREDLKVRKDPEAKAQLELVRKAEKLFMQGLSEAGGTIDAAGKTHLANREEDENTAEAVDEDRMGRYNRNVPRGNDFVTQAMIWERSDGTEIGEEKAFTNG